MKKQPQPRYETAPPALKIIKSVYFENNMKEIHEKNNPSPDTKE